MVEVILDHRGVAADDAAGAEREPIGPAGTAEQGQVPRVGLDRLRRSPCESGPVGDAGSMARISITGPGEPEPDPVADLDRRRPLDRGVVQQGLVVPAQVDQDEALGRRLDPGMEAGDFREGDRIDGDLALGTAAEADGITRHVKHLRRPAGLIHSDPDLHRWLAPVRSPRGVEEIAYGM